MLLSFCLLALGCDSSSTEGSTVEPAPQADTAVEYSDEELRKLRGQSGSPQPLVRKDETRGEPTPKEIQAVCKSIGVFSHRVGLFEVTREDLDLLSVPSWLEPKAKAREPGAPLYARVKQANAQGNRVLLLLHGTKLQTWPGFVGLASTLFPEQGEGQQAQPIVLAFDHRASTKGMCTNLQSFKRALDDWQALAGEPIHLQVDILAMSRGGLLAQVLSQPDLVQAQCPDLIDEHDKDWLAPHSLEIHKTILLATPNSGSSLANGHVIAPGKLGCTYSNGPNTRPEALRDWPSEERKFLAGARQQKPNSTLLQNLFLHPPSKETRSSTWIIASDYPAEGNKFETRVYGDRQNDLVVDLFSSFYRVKKEATKDEPPQQVALAEHAFIVPKAQHTSHLGTPYNVSVGTCISAILREPEGQAKSACLNAQLEPRGEDLIPDLSDFF